MTRDRGYPDWLVLSARLLAQPFCGQVKIVQNICFGRVPLWLCEDITACCYMYCYFRNKAGCDGTPRGCRVMLGVPQICGSRSRCQWSPRWCFR